ncbi:MAG TPA: FtsX-like permease family protein [Candidatus Limnocylindrales bacterium]
MTRGFLSRIRTIKGQLALVAALTAAAGMLLIGAPKVANRLTDEALRARIDSLPFQVKDLTYRVTPNANGPLRPQHAEARLAQQRQAVSSDLTSRFSDSWYAVTTPLETTLGVETGLGKPPNFGLRAGGGLRQASRMVQGRWPDNTRELPRVEVALSEVSAQILNYRVGSDFGIVNNRNRPPVRVRVVGIFTPIDENAPIWDSEPFAVRAYAPQSDEETYQALFLTDIPGMSRVDLGGVAVAYEWRFRLDLSGLDMTALPVLLPALLDARRQGIFEATAETGLDTALTRFADNARSSQAMFAVVQAGTLATLAGLVLLSARLSANRRREEFALLRARGAAMGTVGWRVALELLPVVPLAAFIGGYLGSLAPGRTGETELLLAAFTAIALLALPILAMIASRRLTEERADRPRAGVKRRTAEIGVLALAALGIWLLRRRGLELDLYLVAVPVLLATAAAVITLRLIPAPLALAGRIAARGRGTVAFLGLIRAGRSTPATLGPVAVLIVAVCTTVFSIGIAGTVEQARDRAADHDIPGDVFVQGNRFAVDTGEALRQVPGVTGVSQLAELPALDILSSREVDARRLVQTYVLVVDGPTFAEVASRAGRDVDLPVVLRDARRQQAVPAIASPELAADLAGNGGKGVVDLQGRSYDFHVAEVADTFPMIARTAVRFLVLPWQALPIQPDKVLIPTAYLVSGHADRAALLKVADEGQTRWVSGITEPRIGYRPDSKIKAWQERRAELELSGVNAVLSFAYGVGALGGVVLALLAVGFAVLAEARTRGKALSRLRTMGLAQRQGRRLLLFELAPVVTAAVAAGAAVGLLLPAAVGPALNLTSFTDGMDVGLRLDPLVIGGALGLVLAGLGTALMVEAVFNRRMRLGEVLRVGSE